MVEEVDARLHSASAAIRSRSWKRLLEPLPVEAEPEPPLRLAPEAVVMVCGRAWLWGWGWVLAACVVGAVAGMFAWLAALAAARGGRALDSLLVVLALAGVAAWLERGILRQLKLELRWPAVWLAAEGLGLRREARRREQHPIWTSAIDSVCRLERVRDLKVKTPWAARAAKLLGIEPWTTVWVEELGANRHGRSYVRRHVVPYVVAGHELRDEFWALRLKDQP